MLDVVDALGLCEQEPADAGRIEAALRMMAAAAQLSERGNPLDAMLAAQMAAVHGAAMRAMKRAAQCTDYPHIEALYARQAARLMDLFMRQTAALERRRAAAAARREAAAALAEAQPEALPAAHEQAAQEQPSETARPIALPRAARRKAASQSRRAKQTPHPPKQARNGHRINGTGPPSSAS